MKTAKELDLATNESIVGITSRCSPSTKISYEFKSGDDVTLKKGDIRIHVQNARKQPNGNIIGTVQSVESDKELVSSGVDANTIIEFSEKHIFGCTKR